MERFVNGIRAAMVAELSSCWMRGMSPRRRQSWTTFRWPRKILWITNTSRSVHSCHSACSRPIASASGAYPKNSDAPSEVATVDDFLKSRCHRLRSIPLNGWRKDRGVRGPVNSNLMGAHNVPGNYLPTTSCSRLRPVAALLWYVLLAKAQGDGPDRSATCHRYSAQLPFFRARLHHSRRRRP